MTAYAIFLREETLDPSELDIYTSKATEALSIFETFSPELLAAYGAQEVIEGASIEGVVLVKFPTL